MTGRPIEVIAARMISNPNHEEDEPMKFPKQSSAVTERLRPGAPAWASRGPGPVGPLTLAAIAPQGCDSWKRARCVVKIGAAVAACASGLGPVCAAAVVASGDCCDCLPGSLRQFCD